MRPPWENLLAVAEEEVDRLIAALPSALQGPAREVSLVYEPLRERRDLGIDRDTLGQFVGAAVSEIEDLSLPPHILLFLNNLWDFTDGEWDEYRLEIRRTYFHELGHYLGLEESDLEDRDLL